MADPRQIENDATLTVTVTRKTIEPDGFVARQLGRYHLLERIGEGGMGRVFLGYDPKLHRRVAIKLLKASNATPRARNRLIREARALAQISHPNLVHVYEVGEHDDEVFVVMEYVKGCTLSEWNRQSKRPWSAVLAVLVGAGEGLAAAHRAGIAHRDFKPANVIIDESGVARVVDFGIAIVQDPDSLPDGPLSDTIVRARRVDLAPSVSGSGFVMGTPPYMAPEQHMGERGDDRSDQFGFAVTLYEALYGVRPFPADRARIIEAKLKADVRFPSGDAVPSRVRAVIRRALAPDPGHRFGSMTELIAALEPPKSRAVWIFGGATIVVALAAFGLRPDDPAASHANCDTPPERISAAWNDARRSAVSAAFEASGESFAARSLQTVLARLDEHTERWTAMWRQSCVATLVEGTQSSELFDQRMACLERRLDQTAAMIDVLAEADAEVVERSVLAVSSLTPVAVCADADLLRDDIGLPEDPTQREQAIAVRAELARVDALVEAARWDVATKIARDALAKAERIGHGPLLAEAQLALGETLFNAPAEAEASFRAAIRHAVAGRHDLVAARAWRALVVNIGVEQSRPDEAMSLATGAEAAVERVDADGTLTAELRAGLGSIAAARGHYDEAIAHYEQAELLVLEAYGIEDPRLRAFLNNHGVVLLQQGKLPEALMKFERVLEVAERTLGDTHPYIADYLGNIGLVHLEYRDAPRAREMLHRALAILQDDAAGNRRSIAMLRGNLSFALLLDGALDRARLEAEASYAELEALLGPRHAHLAAPLDVLGLVDLHEDRLDDAAVHFARATELLTASLGDDHPLTAMVRVHEGERLLRKGEAAQAQPLLVAAEAILRHDPGPEHPDYAIATALLAETRIATDPHDAARTLTTAIETMRLLDHRYRGAARFALARALWADPTRRDAAREAARDALVDLARTHDPIIVGVRQWLATHPA